MNIAVIGCGRWGSFLAWYLDSLGHRVTLYGRPGSGHLGQLRAERTNGLVTLGARVSLTENLEEAVRGAETLVVSVGAQSFRGLMEQLAALDLSGKTAVLCMKGLEASTGLRLTQIFAQYEPSVPVAVWVGPGHVQDFTKGIPNCMVVDSADAEAKRRLVSAFSGSLIRFYYGTDLIGTEVGAASKNVIGIAAGILDGLGKTALKGALMSRGTREIARLIRAMGGNEISAYGLAHLGDYEATVFSPYSHNRRFGEAFVRGEPYGELAEGAATTEAMLKLEADYGAELPICRTVDSVLNGGRDANEAISELFLRSLKMEF